MRWRAEQDGVADRGATRLVVLVNDERRAFQRLLANHTKQFELVVLPNAERTAVYVRRHRVDMIVVGGGTNSVDVCRKLRRWGVDVPLALASRHLTSELEHDAYDAGATYALTEPVDLCALFDQTGPNLREIRERQQLIADHMEVARNIARRLARQYGSMLDPEDIAGPAMVGLCEAAARFDRARAQPFLAFAERRIRGAIFDEIRRLSAHGRVMYKRQRKISGARRAITQNGDDPTDDRVAAHLGLSVSAVQKAAERAIRVVDDVTAIPSPGASAEAQLECAEALVSLAHAREVLPHQEATIIHLHYDRGMSLTKIAHALELAPSRVVQLHGAAIAMLRNGLHEDVPGESQRGYVRSR